jgi:hypothetical protein
MFRYASDEAPIAVSVSTLETPSLSRFEPAAGDLPSIVSRPALADLRNMHSGYDVGTAYLGPCPSSLKEMVSKDTVCPSIRMGASSSTISGFFPQHRLNLLDHNTLLFRDFWQALFLPFFLLISSFWQAHFHSLPMISRLWQAQISASIPLYSPFFQQVTGLPSFSFSATQN